MFNLETVLMRVQFVAHNMSDGHVTDTIDETKILNQTFWIGIIHLFSLILLLDAKCYRFTINL